MSNLAIQVERLSKRFHIGKLKSSGSVREALASAMKAPFKRRGADEDTILWALRDVSFSVGQGEVVGLIGRNGAGKSTLLKTLARITRPTSGWAEVHGRIGSLLEVGTGFHHELSGRENIFLSGAVLGMKKSEIAKKFDEIVAFSEIERFLDTPLKHYSSGMQMRLAFAVAAHLEPEILLIDEVLAVGDASFQKKCLGKMKAVARHGRTILFVSHNAVAMRALCTRAVWLDGGKVVEDGGIDEVINHYLPKNPVESLEAYWDESSAPGNEHVRLRSARVIPRETSDGLITVHTPVKIEFTYRNYVEGAVYNVSMILNGADDVCAFNTVSDYGPKPAGLIRQTVEIPGDFLNAGSYSVTMMIVVDLSHAIFRTEKVVGFEVNEGKIVGSWYGQTPGVVRPKLEWKSDILGPHELVEFTTAESDS
jgi:lipopolysaccharide transport system ATP-binding protein